MIMIRQGLPTGQMQEETKELLDDEDIEWCNIVRKKIDNLMIKC